MLNFNSTKLGLRENIQNKYHLRFFLKEMKRKYVKYCFSCNGKVSCVFSKILVITDK